RVCVRPEYPHLKMDSALDRSTMQSDETAGIGCSKYYKSYGWCGLTGGVMGCWCPHLACLCFPTARQFEDTGQPLFATINNNMDHFLSEHFEHDL
ncbi:hypothetical protein BKA62DRAFT_629979, partial [Auriculariales sp. MPI-PUGE-AT-0066]